MKNEHSFVKFPTPKLATVLGMAVLVILAMATIYVVWPLHQVNNAISKTNDLDQILNGGAIRCGYVSNPPSCIVDPKTGKVSGVFAEAIEKVADNLGVKVEWKEEVGFGSMIEGIKANRYDIVPCAIWPTAQRTRYADFSIPLFYSGVGIFVRKDDNRFTDHLDLINSPDVTIATMDGEMSQAIARSDFPKARELAVPQLSEISTMLLNVKNRKADVAFVELYFAHEFLKHNPATIKNIVPDRPIRVFPNTILLKRGEGELKALLNTALDELINLGTVDKLLYKYEPQPGTFYRLAKPYRVPGGSSK